MLFSKNVKPKKVLKLFHIVMINVIAVDSIRTLPFSAEYGFSLVFYYLLASLTFFIPSALVSAELASGWPNTGGIYVWVREAFGEKWSLIIIWLEWVCNIVWYPTIMALIAGVLAYFFNPALANNPWYMTSAILAIFWGITFLNCLGMEVSAWLSTLSAIIGTILPMLFIGALGVVWYYQGRPMEIGFSWSEFFPNSSGIDNLAFLSNVLFGLIGLDMAATHAAEMKNPRKDYPKAMIIAVIIILITIVCSSLAIAMVVPNEQLNLVTGCLQAFSIFFEQFHLHWMIPFIAFFIVLGGLGGVGAWIIGPTKGLMVASRDGSLPISLSTTNKLGVPVKILVLQALIVSILSMVFIFMPSVHSSFWLLSAITAQLAMIVYVFLFLSGIKLQFTKPHVHRAFRVPFGKPGMIVTGVLGALSCLIAIALTFIRSKHVGIESTLYFELSLIGGISLMLLLPYVIHKICHKLG